jgi:hypothetical protein
MRVLSIAAAAVALVTLSACGGSDGESGAASDESSSQSVEESAIEEEDTASEETAQEAESDRPVDLPYFYGFGCEGAGVTLLDLAAFYGEFDPASASLDDAATFRAMGVALTTAADLPEEGALADGVTLADQSIYATGIAAQDLADVIEGGGFTREVEEQTIILGEDATRTVQECGLE